MWRRGGKARLPLARRRLQVAQRGCDLRAAKVAAAGGIEEVGGQAASREGGGGEKRARGGRGVAPAQARLLDNKVLYVRSTSYFSTGSSVSSWTIPSCVWSRAWVLQLPRNELGKLPSRRDRGRCDGGGAARAGAEAGAHCPGRGALGYGLRRALPCLSDLSSHPCFSKNSLYRELLQSVAAMLAVASELGERCREPPRAGKLQMQSDLIALAGKLDLNLRDCALLVKSGVLSDAMVPAAPAEAGAAATAAQDEKSVLSRHGSYCRGEEGMRRRAAARVRAESSTPSPSAPPTPPSAAHPAAAVAARPPSDSAPPASSSSAEPPGLRFGAARLFL
ncbi:hypothetical protein PR202_ga13563 [Eleusine coracana subsp. coracana]|uniref:DUF7032 domain-containing protein n=1 Tax=Eleusine coracana subsp. coracana TaxID=191504 RepID=A0AAV5CEC7_ELECO|nr:hypothetical protein PR202_ga13563 [Eleusine coracana subsp. coracana]